MSSDIAVRAKGVGKRYQLYDKPHHRLQQSVVPRLQRLLGRPTAQYYRDFAALEDVSFEIRRGETVGIVGRNGSGKSTLLQIVCGILNPSSGTVDVNGRIAALLELGAGFNPDFTGSENVRMSCALLGLSAAETDARFDDIAAFADIGDFIHQPVKTYSSGMFVRLAFAVNIVCEPDVMIVDEALSVGDMSFQAKCMTGLTRMQADGATVLFVSHDMGAVKSLCSRAIYLDGGRIQAMGTAADVAAEYTRRMREEMNRHAGTVRQSKGAVAREDAGSVSPSSLPARVTAERLEAFRRGAQHFRYGSGGARILYAELVDEQGQQVGVVEFDQLVRMTIYFETEVQTEITCNYYVSDEKKNFVVGCDPRLAGGEFLHSRKDQKYMVTYEVRLPLRAGNYSVDLELARPLVLDETGEFMDVIDNAIVFRVERRPSARLWAQVYLETKYECRELS
jgi:lipopolysaccharide transport system ATP-binding protein